MLQLRSNDGHLCAKLDLAAGARLASLQVDGLELLVGRDATNHPFGWGSYVMAPFAGRLRRGRFSFEGTTYHMPANLDQHAIHGVVFDAVWEVLDTTSHRASLSCELGDPWPFAGRIVQEVAVRDGAIEQRLTIAANRPMPATLGWHPWFRRQLDRGRPAELQVDWTSARMYQRDDDYMPTDVLVPVTPGPWDDAFVGVGQIKLRWPGALELRVEHDCSHIIIYDQPAHGLCIEPQSDQPDAFTWAPDRCRVVPGHPLSRSTTWHVHRVD